MKKKQIINLIKYHVEKNESGFRDEAIQIAESFDRMGDEQLAAHIMMLISNTNVFVPQDVTPDLKYCREVRLDVDSLYLPDLIKEDILGIINAISHDVGVSKFLFEGAPGTGKTESVKQIARILDRKLYQVDFEELIDSRLGQTVKNISQLFAELESSLMPSQVIILFDEIDAIAIDRINSNDLREMGRATSAVLKGLDAMNEQLMLIATTNLYDKFDKALTRRFDAVIDFNRYTRQDLIDVADGILGALLKRFKHASKNKRLFGKILNLMPEIPYPGELRNVLKTALAFSNPTSEYDYLKKILAGFTSFDAKFLKDKGFTVREIEILTGVSKSQVSRELNDGGIR